MLNRGRNASILSLPRFWVAILLAVVALMVSIISIESARVSDVELKAIEGAAQKLITQNLDVATYMALSPLPIKNDYKPEDYPAGLAPVESVAIPDYKSYSALIKSTFVPSTAALLLGSEVDGVKRYAEVGGKFCRAKALTPEENYGKDLSHMRLAFSNVTKKSADVTLEVAAKGADKKEEIKLQMYKYDDTWLLKGIAF